MASNLASGDESVILDMNAKATWTAYRFLGIRVNPLTVPDLNLIVGSAVATDQKIVIACHNLHSLYLFHHDAKMRSFHAQANYVHIDGMGIVLLGQLMRQPLGRRHRITYLDWLKPLLSEAAARSWRVLYIGMRSSICTRVGEVLGRDFPDLEFRTVHWDIEHVPENVLRESVVGVVNEFRPQILFVGLGMPRQENWILDNFERISASVILPCGAAMDYIAGAAPTPPRWAGRYGVEWLFRFLSEPRHLWRRYLVEPWYILGLLSSELIKAAFLR
jgi:N-acetylglucosaminyldiphosphoundecaprenol N-acetyl-beta-D-mannosaminyltransferase